MLERSCDVDEQRQDLGVRSTAHLAQIATSGKHHRQDGGFGRAHRFVNAQHARVIEPCGQGELALEHFPGGFRVLELGIEDLQRDFGVAQFVTRAPNLAVPAGAEFFYQHETAAQLGAGLVLVGHELAGRGLDVARRRGGGRRNRRGRSSSGGRCRLLEIKLF
jgi:hypothetical protein